VDLSDRQNLQSTLEKIQALGPVGCVYHNAARVKPSEALTTSPDELEEDFRVSSHRKSTKIEDPS
jgi:hypothetical protein